MAALLASALAAYAADATDPSGGAGGSPAPAAKAGVVIGPPAAAGTRLVELSLDPLSLQLVPGAGGAAGVVVRLPGATGRMNEGEPDVPAFTAALPLEPGWTWTGRVTRADWVVVTQGVTVAAVPWRADGAGQAAAASPAGVWPAGPLSIHTAWMGPRKLARLGVCPVRYAAASGTLYACTNLQAALELVPAPIPEGDRGPL